MFSLRGVDIDTQRRELHLAAGELRVHGDCRKRHRESQAEKAESPERPQPSSPHSRSSRPSSRSSGPSFPDRFRPTVAATLGTGHPSLR